MSSFFSNLWHSYALNRNNYYSFIDSCCIYDIHFEKEMFVVKKKSTPNYDVFNSESIDRKYKTLQRNKTDTVGKDTIAEYMEISAITSDSINNNKNWAYIKKFYNWQMVWFEINLRRAFSRLKKEWNESFINSDQENIRLRNEENITLKMKMFLLCLVKIM